MKTLKNNLVKGRNITVIVNGRNVEGEILTFEEDYENPQRGILRVCSLNCVNGLYGS